MKQPKFEVKPNKQTAEEKKNAKILEKVISYEYEKHKEFIEAITKARFLLEASYGIKTVDQPWDLVLAAYMSKFMEKETS